MSFTPSAAAQAAAALAASNMANLAAAVTSWQTAIAGGILTPAAIIDAILSSVGYRAQGDFSTTAVTAGSSFVSIFPAWTVSVPVVKTYLLHVDVSAYIQTVPDRITFQVLLDGSTSGVANPANGSFMTASTTGVHIPKSWRVPVTFPSAGNHTLQLQFKSTGTGTATVDTGDFLLLTLTG